MSTTRTLTVDGITSSRWHGTGNPAICARQIFELIDDDTLYNPMCIESPMNSFDDGDICESCWLADEVIHGVRRRFSWCRAKDLS